MQPEPGDHVRSPQYTTRIEDHGSLRGRGDGRAVPVSDPYGLPEGAGVLLFKTSAGGAVLSHISGLERLLCHSGRIGGTAIER